jgi:hypothetical protein
MGRRPPFGDALKPDSSHLGGESLLIAGRIRRDRLL